MILRSVIVLVVMVVSVATSGEAQDGGTFPQTVAIPATDGLALAGDFYLVDAQHPTVLLLHELYTTRASWNVLIGTLTGAGFNALAVDLRGYGSTGGAINWNQAVVDVQTWLNWLRSGAGVRGDAISIVGSSMGSTLAIVGCANDPACRTAVALSPGWAYYGIGVENALETGRPVLAIYAKDDSWPKQGIPRMQSTAGDSLTVQTYEGNAHGMLLFDTNGDTLIPLIVSWLSAHGS